MKTDKLTVFLLILTFLFVLFFLLLFLLFCKPETTNISFSHVEKDLGRLN